MTAEQQKAKDLIEKFLMPIDELYKYPMCLDTARQCAIIHCDLNLKDLEFTHIGYGKGIISGYQKTKIKFWQTVKQEIINYK